MTIQLPVDVERSIEAIISGGRFATAEEALATAWRSFLRTPQAPQPCPGSGFIGAMREDAELLDEIVAHAMKERGRPSEDEPR
jgi:hypothetical protein